MKLLKKVFKKNVVESPNSEKTISDYKVVTINGFNPSGGKSIVEISSLEDFLALTDSNAVVYFSDGVYIQEFPEAVLTCRKP